MVARSEAGHSRITQSRTGKSQEHFDPLLKYSPYKSLKRLCTFRYLTCCSLVLEAWTLCSQLSLFSPRCLGIIRDMVAKQSRWSLSLDFSFWLHIQPWFPWSIGFAEWRWFWFSNLPWAYSFNLLYSAFTIAVFLPRQINQTLQLVD